MILKKVLTIDSSVVEDRDVGSLYTKVNKSFINEINNDREVKIVGMWGVLCRPLTREGSL